MRYLAFILLFICSAAYGQQQYICEKMTIRGEVYKIRKLIAVVKDSVAYMKLPGADHYTFHPYTLFIRKIEENEDGTVYFLEFQHSHRRALLLINELHIYFKDDREDYLFFIYMSGG